MSDEELEHVAGGTWAQTAEDSEFLNSLGICHKYNTGDLMFTFYNTEAEEEVTNAWKHCGVRYVWHGGAVYDNEYYIGDRKVSRDEAVANALKYWG